MPKSFGRLQVFITILLITATVAIYFQALSAPFIYDDYPHLVENHKFQNSRTIQEILTSGYQETRPLFLLSMALTYQAAGLNPMLYHLVSLVLHLANGLLLLALLISLWQKFPTKSHYLPYLVIAIFLFHPLQTESVTYINSRSGLLMAFFGLLALNAFIAFRQETRRKHKPLYFALTLGTLILADLCKESGAVIPILILLVDVLLFRRPITWKVHLPLLATVLTVPLLFIMFHNPHYHTVGLDVADGWYKVLSQPRVLAHFLMIYFVPFGQNIDYDFPLTRSLLDGEWWLAMALHIGLWRLAWICRRQQPWFSLGIGWFYVGLIPTNSIVPFHDFVAERHLYLSLIGISLALVTLPECFPKLIPYRKIILVICLGWISVLGILTIQRNRVWRSEVELWRDAVGKSPNKARTYFNLGAALASEKTYGEALPILMQAEARDKNNPAVHFNLALVYKNTNRKDLAIKNFNRAIELKPNYNSARLELAGVYLTMKKFALAEAELQQLIDIYPESLDAWLALAKFYAETGNPKLTWAAYQKASGLIAADNANGRQLLREFYQRYLIN